MIVVADSGPLHYLLLLEQTELLRRFYRQVLVPEPVASELSAIGAPAIVRDWITKPPTWVDVRPVTPEAMSTITDDLDLGQRTPIALAETITGGRLTERPFILPRIVSRQGLHKFLSSAPAPGRR